MAREVRDTNPAQADSFSGTKFANFATWFAKTDLSSNFFFHSFSPWTPESLFEGSMKSPTAEVLSLGGNGSQTSQSWTYPMEERTMWASKAFQCCILSV